MKLLVATLLCSAMAAPAQGAIWEIDLGGLAGEGLLGGNVIDNRADSGATGKEVGHNEIPGILYDDAANALEFHVGWGSHEIVKGRDLAGQYLTSALFGPASISENASQALYSFDSSNGYVPTVNDPTGRIGFIHARVQLVDLPGYTVAQQEADLLASRFYFSISSTAYETGEIRGQLLAAVPEPKEYALMTGAVLLGFAMLRRRKLVSTSS